MSKKVSKGKIRKLVYLWVSITGGFTPLCWGLLSARELSGKYSIIDYIVTCTTVDTLIVLV